MVKGTLLRFSAVLLSMGRVEHNIGHFHGLTPGAVWLVMCEGKCVVCFIIYSDAVRENMSRALRE